jgi:phage gp46-like protein
MADFDLRVAEGCEPDQNLLWDTVWDAKAGCGNWAVTPAGAATNRGGLKATAALETAVIISLWTDRACPKDHPLYRYADGDPRGWWGDGMDVRADLGEAPLGSLLWLLERSAIDEVATPRWAQSFALDALAWMVDQRVAARIEAQASVSKSPNRLDLAVQIYGQDGGKIYDRRFEDVWAQAKQGI